MASIATVCSRTTPSGRGLFSLASLRAALPATPSETRAFHASSSARAETSTSNSAETTAERIGRPVRLPMGPPKKAKRVFPVPERVLDWAKDGAAEESLKVDGKGNKYSRYLRNILHLNPKRFYPLAEQIIGLSVEQAILECRWTQNTTGRVAEQTVLGAAIKAKALGMDLSKCYITDADIVPRAVVHPSLKLRGRGPYGATPHPQTALFHLVITQRNDLPQQLPSIRLTGRPELEQLRARLRAWMVDRDAHYHYGVSKVTDSEGNVKLGRRKPEGIKELGGFPIVGVEKRRKVVVFN